MKYYKIIVSITVALSFFTPQISKADAFTAGNLVVLQVGLDGAGSALTANSAAAVLKEFSTFGGSAIQTIFLPTAVNGSQNALTFSGSATSEGQLLLSGDSHYLTFAGYNTGVGTASITTSAASAINRVIGVVDSSGVVDTTTAVNTGSPGNPRSAISSDGTQLWLATSAVGVGAITKGTVGATTQLSTTPVNTRVLGISGGQLYVDSAAGTVFGVAAIGTGEPTTSGQTTTLLPGFPTSGTHSSYDFAFANASTLYVADDGTAVNGGGIQKWVLSAGTWSLAYNVVTNAVRSFVVDVSGANPIFYAVSTTNSLISVTDIGSATTATLLEAGTANTAFRGVAFAPSPVPEPTTMALAAVGGMACLFAFRRRR